MDDLNLGLKFVNLALHKLLCDLGEELEVELDKAAFHDLLTELDSLLLALLNDLPQLV